MSYSNEYEDGDEFSDIENDDAFDEDMEALRRACMITGVDPNDLDNTNHLPLTAEPASSGGNDTAAAAADAGAWSSDSDDDLELVRNIQNRLALSDVSCQPLSLKALCTLPPIASDDEEDDFETLRVIQQRFSAYNLTDYTKSITKDSSENPNQFLGISVNRIDACEGFQDSEGACNNLHLSSDNEERQPSPHKFSMLRHKHSNFPKSAQLFIDAIKKNRSYQKFIRSKLTQIESRIEENEALRNRVKVLKTFQVSCRKITGRALSQKKDPRVQLISMQKSRNSKDSEVTDKKFSAMHYGPAENSHVANYRMAFTKYPLSLHRRKWSETESENLRKGIRQQFQEMVLQVSMDRLSGTEGSSANGSGLDDIFASVKDLEVTPEMIREFLPKVNWDKLASMYVEGRSGAECDVRWLNFEDPLINHDPWSVEEDKSLLLIIQEKGITNWFDIAILLGTNRTPFQCLARYQRSLNACILKKEWTEDEDEQLRMAVKAFGERDWQSVASVLEGRTGPQCSNRWKKTLHPTRQRVGRWTPDEDKRLTVATVLFGPKNWKKIAEFVPGRTQVQCRERWVNSLDPSVIRGEWTEEEDLMLEAAIAEHGFSWSKVAAAVPSRTDNQCWRRWKVLHPNEVPLLQAARKMQKAALICNFVDRERERPALGPSDFMPLALMNSASEPENVNSSHTCERKSRGKQESGKKKDAAPCNGQKNTKSRRLRKKTQIHSEEVLGLTDVDVVENSNQCGVNVKKKTVKPQSGNRKVNSGPDTVKKVSKRCSKGKSSTELDERYQRILLPPSEILEAPTTNGDSSKTLCGNNHVSNSQRRVPNLHSGSNICSKSSQEQGTIRGSGEFISSGPVDGSELMHNHADYPDLTSLTTSNGEVVDAMAGIDASRKRSALKPSKKKLPVKLGAESSDLSSHPQRATRYEGENSFEGNEGLKKHDKRKRHNEPSGDCQTVAHIPCREDRDETSEHASRSYSEQVLEASEGDDITLACFLRNTSKKRRLKAAESTIQTCRKVLSKRKRHNEPSGDCQTVAHIPCREDRDETSEHASRSYSEQVLEASEGDDITLACFLCNTSKKRRLKAAESTIQT